MTSYFNLRPYDPEYREFHAISCGGGWAQWISSLLPDGADINVRKYGSNNLKHIIFGLELKHALLKPHYDRNNNKNILFEPYAHIMTFEFCVGVFSICEFIGVSLSVTNENRRVNRKCWKKALCQNFSGDNEFEKDLDTVCQVRDRLHQDRLSSRRQIDWHDFGDESALQPAMRTLNVLFLKNSKMVPQDTNLKVG